MFATKEPVMSLLEHLGGLASVLPANTYGAWRDGQFETVLQNTSPPTYSVPTGTRVIRLELQTKRGRGDVVDGYAENLSFILREQ